MRKGDVWLCRSQFVKTHVTPHQKVGMSKVAYHRMLVGGQRNEERQNAETRKNMTATQYVGVKCSEIVFSMCSVQRGSMEAKPLGFVLHTGGLWAPLVNQAHVYVCSGRAGGNERRLLFFVRYVETWHHHIPPHHSHLTSRITHISPRVLAHHITSHTWRITHASHHSHHSHLTSER